MSKMILWDVDGTLVRVGGAGRDAIGLAMARVYGLDKARTRELLAGVDFRGRTDALLLEEIAALLGQKLDGALPTLATAYLDALNTTLDAAHERGTLELLPGVKEALRALEERGIVSGLLTGNIREGARRKLERFGLDYLVERPGGFGDHAPARAEIARLAVAQCTSLGVRADNVVVVGDTEHDVAAARAAGARAVTVATGWTDTTTLAAADPDLQLPSFEDVQPFLRWLDTF